MRRNGVSLFFSLSLFNFRGWPAFFRLACVAGVPFPFPFERLPRRLFSARLHWPKAVLAQATWREKRYVISAFILHFESPLPDALLPESEQVLQKQKCSGSNLIKAMKINIWRPSIKLVWRVCFICVLCYATRMAGGGGGYSIKYLGIGLKSWPSLGQKIP